jgi:phospholipid/cholesterol/gamma-HCH transport system substrate-binding protein
MEGEVMARFLKNTDPRFHLVEARAKWTLVMLAVVLLGLASLAVWQQEWLRVSRHVVFTAPSSEGISPGIAIRLSGFRIGKIKSVTLAGPGRVRVDGLVFEKYAGYLSADTTAMLRSENLISDRFIELTPGDDPQGNPLDPDTPLPLQAEPGIGAMVDALREEIRPVINEAIGITRYLTDPAGDLKTSVANIRKLTDTLNEETGPTLVSGREAITSVGQMVDGFQDPAGSLQQSLANFEKLTVTLDKDFTEVLDRFDKAADSAIEMFDHLDTLVGKLELVVDETAPEVPPMVRKGRSTLDKADDVVGSVRNLWPLRGGLPKDEEKTLRPSNDQP